jgi:hypothetical protein
MKLALMEDAGISLLLTLLADSLGWRRIFIARGLLVAFSGVVPATTMFAAVVGVTRPNFQSLANRPADLHQTRCILPVWRLHQRRGNEQAVRKRQYLPTFPTNCFVISLELAPLV